MTCVLTQFSIRVPPLGAQVPAVNAAPQIERPIAFDAAKRILVLTPTMAARLKLSAPEWPLGNDWKEARLYALDTTATSTAVLVAQRVDGAVARYVLTHAAVSRLADVIGNALVAQGSANDGSRGGTSMILSEPAGNAFVRNQTTLGLIAYGPAVAAILSEGSGAAAGGGYLLAAGTSFFASAAMIRSRSITRAQTILSFHGGTRGAGIGAAIAEIADAKGGAGFGAPILAGSLGGTIAGFRAARGLSDGEAASSGFVADIFGLTTLGVSGAFGAFEEHRVEIVDGAGQYLKANNRSRRRVALGATVAATLAGYVAGPRYARRSGYNVTAGDIDVAFTSAVLGGVLANTFIGDHAGGPTRFGVSTGGLLLGALAADLTKVRHGDRTSSDGTLVQLGAFAGALMGGGIATMTDAAGPVSAGLVGLGGVAGLALADAMIGPASDAGPRRGVSPSGDRGSANVSRVSLSILPAATAFMMRSRGDDRRIVISERPAVRNMPVIRIAF